MPRPSSTEIAAVDAAVEDLIAAHKLLMDAEARLTSTHLDDECWNDCDAHPVDAVSDASGCLAQWIDAARGWLAIHDKEAA
jgi:hypothetical protein